MKLDELKVNRMLYKGQTSPQNQSAVSESADVNSKQNFNEGSSPNGNLKEIASGSVISSCFVRTSEKNTRVELVPFSFNTSGEDVFGEETYIDALIAWRDVNDPAVVIDQHGILVTELFVEETFTVLGDLDVVGNFNYQGALMPRIYFGLVNSTGAEISLPPFWSSAALGTGDYEVTHNLGAVGNYAVLLTPYEATGATRDVTLYSIGANSFRYAVRDSGGTLTDTIVTFSVMGNFS